MVYPTLHRVDTRTYKGMRLGMSNQFDHGAVEWLQNTGYWLRPRGTGGVIWEDGVDHAYCNAWHATVAASRKAFYLDYWSWCIYNRSIECTVTNYAPNTVSGLFCIINAAINKYFAVTMTSNFDNSTESFSYRYALGGIEQAQAIGTLTDGVSIDRRIRVDRIGSEYYIDIADGALTATVVNPGDTGISSDQPGLYYYGPTVDYGLSENATWKDYKCTFYPYA